MVPETLAKSVNRHSLLVSINVLLPRAAKCSLKQRRDRRPSPAAAFRAGFIMPDF